MISYLGPHNDTYNELGQQPMSAVQILSPLPRGNQTELCGNTSQAPKAGIDDNDPDGGGSTCEP